MKQSMKIFKIYKDFLSSIKDSLIHIVENESSQYYFLRFLFFLTTFVIAMTSVAGPAFIFIPFFPTGLFTFFFRSTRVTFWSTFIGWVIYLIIFLTGTLTYNWRVLVYIYIIFLILLAFNIAGCRQILPTLSFD